jgi:hypothetical protein
VKSRRMPQTPMKSSASAIVGRYSWTLPGELN